MRDDIKSRYLKGVRELARTRNMPDLLRFMYLHNNPDDYHDALPTSTSYYVFQQDVIGLDDLTHSGVVANLGTSTIIDLGPGDINCFRQKVFPLIVATKAKRYVAVDFSTDILAAVTNIAGALAPELKIASIENDFFKNAARIPSVANSLLLLLGNTLGNLPVYKPGTYPLDSFVQFLMALKNRLGSNSTLLVSVDTNDNAEGILAAYTSSLTTSFFMRALHWIAEQGPGFRDFASGLKPRVAFDINANCVVYELLCHIERTVLIGNQSYHLHKGDEFVVGVSYRFSANSIQLMFNQAGFKTIASAKAPAGSVLCTLLRP